MGKSMTCLFMGMVLIILGTSNYRGNVSSIHWYNRTRVSREDMPKYARCVGSGTLVVGISLIVSALLESVFQTSVFDYLILLGCAVGLGIVLYGQFKYNHGIF